MLQNRMSTKACAALLAVSLVGAPVAPAVAEEEVPVPSAEAAASGDAATDLSAAKPEAPAPARKYVATFFNDDEDWSDCVYVSSDCEHFYQVSTAPNEGRDPSVMWHDGRFWTVTCRNDGDGYLWFVVSSSTDLLNWSEPTTNGPFVVDELPDVGGDGYNVVAPEWFVDAEGGLHIIVSCGWWGANHGVPTDDHMQAYLVDLADLTYRDDGLCEMTVIEGGQKLSINADGADRIDGTVDYYGGKYWLTIKRNGLTTEVWRNDRIAKTGWTLVRDKALYGFEGNCVVGLGDGLCMFADGVPDIAPYGVRRWVTTDLGGNWEEKPLHFYDLDGNERGIVRHGTVLEVPSTMSGAYEAVNALFE